MKPDGLDRLDYFASQLAKHGVYYGWSHTYSFTIRPGDRSRVSGFEELMAKGRQDLRLHELGRGRAGPDDRDGRQSAQAQEPLHRQDLRPRTRPCPTSSCRTRTTFSSTPPAPPTRLAPPIASCWKPDLPNGSRPSTAPGETGRGLGRRPENRGAAGRRQHRRRDQSLVHGDGGLPKNQAARGSGCWTTPPSCTSRRTNSTASSSRPFATPDTRARWSARPGRRRHAAALLQPAVRRPGRLPSTATITSAAASPTACSATPGGGYLSSGLQQVADRPFGVSEWIHVYPSLYSAEGPILMAAYGTGPAGLGRIVRVPVGIAPRPMRRPRSSATCPSGVWNADAPTQIGQYPILARMIFRGDVTTAPGHFGSPGQPGESGERRFNFTDTIRQRRRYQDLWRIGAGRIVGRRPRPCRVRRQDRAQHLSRHGQVQARHGRSPPRPANSSGIPPAAGWSQSTRPARKATWASLAASGFPLRT